MLNKNKKNFFIQYLEYLPSNIIVCVCVCVCVFVCVCVGGGGGHVYVVYEDTNLYNDMGMT